MATTLCAITNSKLTGTETHQDWDRIVHELNQFQFTDEKKELINWGYEIIPEDKELDIFFEVNFYGDFYIQPSLYTNIGILITFNKYRYLYEVYELGWLERFRKNMYNIIKTIGGTEIIYLADCGCDKLSTYLECMAWENIPYEVIKEKMIQEFGQPKTDYSQLKYETLTYSNITEFFLDDFKDLK